MVIACAALPILGGCAAPATMKAGDTDSPTRGYAILFAESDLNETRYRRYELLSDGTLKVGGGKVAMMRETDWSTQPSKESIDSILRAVREAGLLERPPECTLAAPSDSGEKDRRRTEIEIVGPEVRRQYDLAGTCPGLAPVRAAFEAATKDRFQKHIDALPDAGPRPVRRGG